MSNVQLMTELLSSGASQSKIYNTFKRVYAKHGVDDENYIKSRVDAYKRFCKRTQIVPKSTKQTWTKDQIFEIAKAVLPNN